MTEVDPREAEWLAPEAKQLAKGRCPYSGLILHRDGEAGPHVASCDMCDCFGYEPTQVKVWPRPLRVVRWKVTRKTCMECNSGFGGNTGSNVCDRCLEKALGYDKLRIPF